MINHIWTVICSRAVIDRDSNNISLQNVLEQITIPSEPDHEAMIAISFSVVSMWTRVDPSKPSSGNGRLIFVSPSDKELGGFPFDVYLEKYTRTRTRIHFTGIPIKEAGCYQFKVEIQDDGKNDWRQVAAVPLEIVISRSGRDRVKDH